MGDSASLNNWLKGFPEWPVWALRSVEIDTKVLWTNRAIIMATQMAKIICISGYRNQHIVISFLQFIKLYDSSKTMKGADNLKEKVI